MNKWRWLVLLVAGAGSLAAGKILGSSALTGVGLAAAILGLVDVLA